MKNIKTYEEFDWHQVIQDNWEITTGIAGWSMAYFGTKFLNKLHTNSTIKKRFKDMMSGNYPNRNWIIEKDGYIIKLIQKYGYSKESNLRFIINTKEKTLEYVSDAYPIKLKLKDNELKNIIDGIEFTKQVSESVNDFYYELSDNGFTCELDGIDFYKKSFAILITKSKINENFINEGELTPDDENIDDEEPDNDEYEDYDEEPDYDDDHYPNSFTLEDIFTELDELLFKVTSTYNVIIDKQYIPYLQSERNKVKVTEYKEGYIKLSNGCYKDDSSKEEKYIRGVIKNGLIVPFIKT